MAGSPNTCRLTRSAALFSTPLLCPPHPTPGTQQQLNSQLLSTQLTLCAKTRGGFDFSQEIMWQGLVFELNLQCYVWRAARVIQCAALHRFHRIRDQHIGTVIWEINGHSQPLSVLQKILFMFEMRTRPFTVTFLKFYFRVHPFSHSRFTLLCY